jgi:glucose/arabinose dehydrogenase
MPAMSPGAHAIEIASFVVDGGAVIESGRSSPPLRVTLSGATAGLPPDAAASATKHLTTADGVEIRLDLITTALVSPTAMAIAPDGRVFLAEREGRVRILENGTLDPEPAVVLDDAAMTPSSEGGLLALALDSQFEQNGFVYAAYTVAASEDTRKVRVVRFREVGGRLGERLVVLRDTPASARPAVSLRAGPDGKLYVALDVATGTGRVAALASYSGKVLRLNSDGTTPPDQPGRNPVFATDVTSPRGMDWHPSTGALWLADAKRRDAEELRSVGPGTPSPARARVALPLGAGAAAMAFYRGTIVPGFSNDLFVAAEEGGYLLRLTFDARDPSRVVSNERLLEDAGSRIRSVAAGADGTVYVATDQAVLRIGPR